MVVIESRIIDRVYNRPISRSILVQVDNSFSLLVYLIGYLVLIHHTDKRFSWPLCTVKLVLSSIQQHKHWVELPKKYCSCIKIMTIYYKCGAYTYKSQMSTFRYVGHDVDYASAKKNSSNFRQRKCIGTGVNITQPKPHNTILPTALQL